jgi:Nucleotidyltransferase/DNA polymerase involved in DNA repair
MSISSDLFAALLVREFPAQALLRLRNELRSQPCVVMEGEPPLQQVVSLNIRANSLGIAHGMTKVEVDTFPEIVELRRSLDEENSTRKALLECAGGFSPRIEDCSEDGVFLCVIDIAGTEKLFGQPQTLAKSLLARLKALGIAACIAVSRNRYAAVTLAKGIAARHIKVIPMGKEAAELAPLSLSVLELTEAQAETFSLWGIRTLGLLAALPEKELIARIGQSGKRLRQLARGEMPHLFQPMEPVFSLQERMELESPVELLDALMFVVNVMLKQLILRVTARVLALASVTVKLNLESDITHSSTVRPALPTTDRQIWLRLLHLELEAHPPQAAILAVALEAEPGSTSKVQLGLFSPQLPEHSRLDVTLARIRALVGDGNVGCPVLKDTNQLDGFVVKPFCIPTTQAAEIIPNSLCPAMRMLRPAEATFVTVESQRPKIFIFRGNRYDVKNAYGPWLTSGEWWSPTLWGCEQWDLIGRARSGNVLCCCLVRDRMQSDWRMVALYD